MKARLRPLASIVRRSSSRPASSPVSSLSASQRATAAVGPELGRDVGARGAFAHDIGVAALSQGQQQRVDQDRLAGAGLAGQDREARRELEFEFVDDDEVADRERDQHASDDGLTVQPRECDSLGITLQCSFWRSVAKKL